MYRIIHTPVSASDAGIGIQSVCVCVCVRALMGLNMMGLVAPVLRIW